jgi:hypothetical protein
LMKSLNQARLDQRLLEHLPLRHIAVVHTETFRFSF